MKKKSTKAVRCKLTIWERSKDLFSLRLDIRGAQATIDGGGRFLNLIDLNFVAPFRVRWDGVWVNPRVIVKVARKLNTKELASFNSLRAHKQEILFP